MQHGSIENIPINSASSSLSMYTEYVAARIQSFQGTGYKKSESSRFLF